jgi:hypothetical protein
MTDTVIQSFCERCGKRHSVQVTQEVSEPAPAPTVFGRFKRKSRDAEETTGSTPAPTGALEQASVHFCLECRRYNCTDCWNEEAGLCVSCRPRGVAPAETEDDRSDVPSWVGARGAAGTSPAPVGDVDEWGRPRSPQSPAAGMTSAAAAVSDEAVTQPPTATIFGPVDDPDPWRGVVFSGESSAPSSTTSTRATVEAPEPPSQEATTPGQKAEPEWPDERVTAWPQADTRPLESPAIDQDVAEGV